MYCQSKISYHYLPWSKVIQWWLERAESFWEKTLLFPSNSCDAFLFNDLACLFRLRKITRKNLIDRILFSSSFDVFLDREDLGANFPVFFSLSLLNDDDVNLEKQKRRSNLLEVKKACLLYWNMSLSHSDKNRKKEKVVRILSYFVQASTNFFKFCFIR